MLTPWCQSLNGQILHQIKIEFIVHSNVDISDTVQSTTESLSTSYSKFNFSKFNFQLQLKVSELIQ